MDELHIFHGGPANKRRDSIVFTFPLVQFVIANRKALLNGRNILEKGRGKCLREFKYEVQLLKLHFWKNKIEF